MWLSRKTALGGDLAAHIPEHELVPVVLRCVERLLNEDAELLALGVHEQAISGRLAGYLQHECRDSNVDTEYNRHAVLVKKAMLPSGRKKVVPDIVVHSRGNDERNRLVIELKIEGRGDDDDRRHAHEKLDALVRGDEFRYELGLYLELGFGDGGPRVMGSVWYVRDQL